MSQIDVDELPVVLCLHSLFLDPRMFDDLVAASAGRFRVVRPEFLGQCSRTGAATTTITMDECADDMIALIERLGVAPVLVVGQSMGGDVAVRIAARRPELVSAMVLAGSSARSEPPEHLERFYPLVDDIARNGFVGETLETIFAIMFGETTRRDPARAPVAAIWHERIAALPPGLHHAIRGVIDREDATALLAGIRVPVLVISGAEDPTRPPAWSEELAAAIPDAELWRLEGVGHSPVLEAPETVVPRVLDFFARSAVRSRA